MQFIDTRLAYRAQPRRLSESVRACDHAISPIELVELDRKLAASSFGTSLLNVESVITWILSIWCGCMFRNPYVDALELYQP